MGGSRICWFAAFGAASTFVLAGCSAKPATVGQQSVEGRGSAGLGSIRVSGPRGAKSVTFDRRLQFPVRLEIQGPADGAAQITAQVTGIPVGACDFQSGFSFTVPLDASGKAAEERMLSYGAPQTCAVEFDVTVGTERQTTAVGLSNVTGNNYPGGEVDAVRATIVFTTQN